MRIDTGFRSSVHGYPFPNTWRDAIFGIVASRGRCGGMVFSALDHFLAGERLPAASVELPAHDSPLARHIWGRQVTSVVGHYGWNLWRFALLSYLPTWAPGGAGGVTRREIARILDALRAGRPVPLGLVSTLGFPHLARNHQVLAYAAEADADRVLLSIYDPNFPLRDDVTLDVRFDVRAPVVERVSTRRSVWRGLFAERYASARAAHAGTPVASRSEDYRMWLAFGALVVGIALVWRRFTRGR